jgi:FKBP-type peptidyl-prolyl cis-trans isomerase
MKKVLSPAALACVLLLAHAADAQTRRGRAKSRRPAPAKSAAAKAKPAAPTAARLNVSVTTPAGLTYVLTRRGEGAQAKAGDDVLVHYTGMLTDGTVFDSSRTRGEPFQFRLGAGRVIKGWDEGIARLRVGDRALLVIPPALGYGSRGAGGVIPPDATLVFAVELVEVKPTSPQQ